MSREIDERKKRKALAKLRKAAEQAGVDGHPELSDWERTFVEEVTERVETYGSAFRDPEKGAPDEPLSALQQRKLKEIDKKARGKMKPKRRKPPLSGKGGFKSKKTKQGWSPRVRDIHEDISEPEALDTACPSPPTPTRLVSTQAAPQRDKSATGKPSKNRPSLRIIDGGKSSE